MQDSQSGCVNALPRHYEHWIRQSESVRKAPVERVYQISRVSPGQEPLVIASCGKASAQKFLAAISTQSGPDRYRITAVFEHPVLPGFQAIER